MSSLKSCLAKKTLFLPGWELARVGAKYLFIGFLIDGTDYEKDTC